MFQRPRTLIASIAVIFLIVFAFTFCVVAQNPTCTTNPELCVHNEQIPYPSGHGQTLFIQSGTNLAFYGIVGEAPNQQIVVTYQPGYYPNVAYRHVWVLDARTEAPEFDDWTKIDRGCFQFWGYGLPKRERVCLYEWVYTGS